MHPLASVSAPIFVAPPVVMWWVEIVLFICELSVRPRNMGYGNRTPLTSMR